MATIQNALNVLSKCRLLSTSRYSNPGKYHFRIQYGYPDTMDYDDLGRELESIGLRGSPTRLGQTYRKGDFEVTIQRPGATTLNFGSESPVALLLGETHVKIYETLHERLVSR